MFFSWFEHVISDCNHTNRRLESASPPEGKATPCPNRCPPRPGDVNTKQQLPLYGRPPCESRLLLCSRDSLVPGR